MDTWTRYLSALSVCIYLISNMETLPMQWGGRIVVQAPSGSNGAEQIECSLTLDNLLLRGSKLRNTGHVFALVLYTGAETKIRQNSTGMW